MKWRLAQLAVGASIISAAAGCGDDQPAAPLTKAQFIERADAVCATGDARFQRLYERHVRRSGLDVAKQRRTMAEATAVVERVFAPTIRWELDELRALGAPRGDERRVAAILDAVETGLERVEESPRVVGNTEDEFKRSFALATDYGLTVCGR